mmetsp:Transcript_22177/g.89748  ORF Transcript_22177/g.89748 Transcript_22177/m.89748 type:complete len:99 (+) Transcript_22177:675-971(+)
MVRKQEEDEEPDHDFTNGNVFLSAARSLRRETRLCARLAGTGTAGLARTPPTSPDPLADRRTIEEGEALVPRLGLILQEQAPVPDGLASEVGGIVNSK